MKQINVAIDGTSSSGKSTMARALAAYSGLTYIDSGAMYRAVTLYCLRHNLVSDDGVVNEARLKKHIGDIRISFRKNEKGDQETYLNDENVEREIRTLRVSNFVSPVAAIPFVRHAMVAQQQEMGRLKGVVMDGRDIGTTVFPDAEIKVFVTCSAQVRAQRRFLELQSKGDTDVTFEDVLRNVEMRDHIDSTRKESPLRKADDAIELDTSLLSLEQQNQWIFQLYDNYPA
ncbi:MAG: (d)CMP kinase [Muribaculaceae bacterium]|nr:(d)CMP kinase [Muribaculaceae bacterium]